jgi:adenylate cyclase
VSLVMLEGSARRSRQRFQVDARLVQASSGVTLWNDSVQADLGDVFGVRDRLTRGIISRLGVTPAPARRHYEVNAQAYGLYLTARALVSRRGVQSPQKAVEYLQQVIAMEPAFAPDYVRISPRKRLVLQMGTNEAISDALPTCVFRGGCGLFTAKLGDIWRLVLAH